MLNYMYISFYFRKSSVDPTTGSVYLRVTINNNRATFGAVTAIAGLGLPKNMSVETKYWDERKGRIRSACPHARPINQAIEACEKKLDKLYAQHEGFDKYMDVNAVKKLFLEGGRIRPSLPDLIGGFTEERLKIGTKKTTVETYNFKFRPLLKFLTDRGWLTRPAEDFTPGLLKEYRVFLISERNNIPRSADKACQVIKTLFLWAAQSERISQNPLMNIRVHVDRTPNLECLTQAEVEKLHRANLEPRLRKIADCFRFACYTGVAYQDLKNLTEDSIKTVEGKLCLVGKRQKTDTVYVVPITPPITELMSKYGGIKMPLPTVQQYNMCLKFIMQMLGIDKRITSHTARKTFADWCINELGMSDEATVLAMGQTSPKELKPYRRIRAKRLLAEFPENLTQSGESN